MSMENTCEDCALRRTIKTVEGVVIAHKCIQHDEFITDFAHACSYWQEMPEELKEVQRD